MEVEDKIDNPYSILHATPLVTTPLQEYDGTEYYPYEVFARDSLCASTATIYTADATTNAVKSNNEVSSLSASVATKADNPYTLTVNN